MADECNFKINISRSWPRRSARLSWPIPPRGLKHISRVKWRVAAEREVTSLISTLQVEDTYAMTRKGPTMRRRDQANGGRQTRGKCCEACELQGRRSNS